MPNPGLIEVVLFLAAIGGILWKAFGPEIAVLLLVGAIPTAAYFDIARRHGRTPAAVIVFLILLAAGVVYNDPGLRSGVQGWLATKSAQKADSSAGVRSEGIKALVAVGDTLEHETAATLKDVGSKSSADGLNTVTATLAAHLLIAQQLEALRGQLEGVPTTPIVAPAPTSAPAPKSYPGRLYAAGQWTRLGFTWQENTKFLLKSVNGRGGNEMPPCHIWICAGDPEQATKAGEVKEFSGHVGHPCLMEAGDPGIGKEAWIRFEKEVYADFQHDPPGTADYLVSGQRFTLQRGSP